MPKRAAIYVRVSTHKQTVENQLSELRQIAERRGWQVVQEYRDAGIRGAKGRDGRPGLDQMLKDEFDSRQMRWSLKCCWPGCIFCSSRVSWLVVNIVAKRPRNGVIDRCASGWPVNSNC